MDERTSKRVASDASIILDAFPSVHLWRGHKCVRITLDLWKRCRSVAGSALTQTADRGRIRPKSDDIGFDPRDGGKIGREHVPRKPRRARRGVARKGQGKGRRAKR